MSNERERLAREWATSTLPRGDAKTLAAIEHIMATTTEPTMADAEWDDDKHYLAGATTSKGGSVVMLWHDDIDTGHIITDHAEWPRDRLTPNGKRYELREVTDRHPETLRTVEDYENAPIGSVVIDGETLPWMKTSNGIWAREVDTYVDRDMFATGPYRVLRWGWGE